MYLDTLLFVQLSVPVSLANTYAVCQSILLYLFYLSRQRALPSIPLESVHEHVLEPFRAFIHTPSLPSTLQQLFVAHVLEILGAEMLRLRMSMADENVELIRVIRRSRRRRGGTEARPDEW